jgi:hypothetical protein
MWIVAIRAGNLPFPERHVSRTLHLRAPHLVALEADLHCGLLDELAVAGQGLLKSSGSDVRLHHLVTGYASHPATLVRAALPEEARAFGMALLAFGILLLHREWRILTEAFDSFDVASTLDVGAAWPVTGFTASPFQVSFRMQQERPAHGSVFPRLHAVHVAGCARFAADILGFGLGFRNLCEKGIAFYGHQCDNGERWQDSSSYTTPRNLVNH